MKNASKKLMKQHTFTVTVPSEY